ncbi:MAG: hypothetical protein HYZ81_00785, partial [Nitrospinae bacterium]|nr:hypothetical protein [Nitrospinota bacterium]
TEVLVQAEMADYRGSYQKFRLRGSVDYPLAGTAVVARLGREGTVLDARIAITAVNPSPHLIPGVSEILQGHPPAEPSIALVVERALRVAKPLKTSASTPDYRRYMLGWLVTQGLRAVLMGSP